MCLLAVLFHAHPDAPLVIAANRDEWLARPAAPMGLLRAANDPRLVGVPPPGALTSGGPPAPPAPRPRIAGGRDLLAGGTWLAIGEHGVIAGLTNRPTAAGRDASKRSRGELPMAL